MVTVRAKLLEWTLYHTDESDTPAHIVVKDAAVKLIDKYGLDTCLIRKVQVDVIREIAL